MKKQNETKKRIIAAATHLFRRRGYFGTGLSEILKESGAPKGSFYFHFPEGKDQLAAITIDAAAEDTERVLMSVADQSNDIAEFIDRLIESYARLLERSDFEAGSLLANTSLDVAPANDLITGRIQQGYRKWHKVITGFCTQQGMSRQQASDMAVLLIASLEGALSLCRAEKTTAPLKAAARQIKQISIRQR